MEKYRLIWETETRETVYEESYGGAYDIDSFTRKKILWEGCLEKVPTLSYFKENDIVTDEMLEDMIPEGICNTCDSLELQVWKKSYWNHICCLNF
ncbi:hypothetical protein GF391_03025 [Candidatus Uhrbacteria bacterium]|nr:hypothetical protein [Candidatus Uhrbacteria bacterium]